MSDGLAVYEFGVMSSVYTLEAPSDRVADAAMYVALYPSNAPIVVYQPESRVLPSVLDYDMDAKLREHFGGDLNDFFMAHREAIDAAVESVQEGKVAERQARDA